MRDFSILEPAPGDITIETLLDALDQRADLDRAKRRHLKSALTRFARLVHRDPKNIVVEVEKWRRAFEQLNPVALGLKPKSVSNLRWGLTRALHASNLVPGAVIGQSKTTLEWKAVLGRLDKRQRIPLSRIATYSSRHGISPAAFGDTDFAAMTVEICSSSLRQNQEKMFRPLAKKWNAVRAAFPDLCLRTLTVPPPRQRDTRYVCPELPQSFLDDLAAYQDWCGNSDPFDKDSRSRTLATSTLRIQRYLILDAASILVQSGREATTVSSLADLVAEDSMRSVFRSCRNDQSPRPPLHQKQMASILMQIAADWAKRDSDTLQQLKKLTKILPSWRPAMTEANKEKLRQFDERNVLLRLLGLPDILWAEVRQERKPSGHTLAKAQGALAIAIGLHAGLRMQNLASLQFGHHLHLNAGPGSVSSLEIPGSEVKNGQDIAFDIPEPIAAMLREYRDEIAPRIIGGRPTHLFVNRDGKPKTHQGVRALIRSTMKRRVGVDFHPHLFRHLLGKIILDAEPGAFETVKQILGHRSLNTTTSFYTGVNPRRAGRHYQTIMERVIGERSQPRRTTSRKKKRHAAAA